MKTHIGKKQIQKFLQIAGFYNGMIDGIIGKKSVDAAITYVQERFGSKGWPKPERYMNAVTQALFLELGLEVGEVDGLWGPNSMFALEQYQNLMRDVPATPEEISNQPTKWPRYQDMEFFYGPVGRNISRHKLPYTMRLAWDTNEKVSAISLHNKCGASAVGVLEAARDHYGIKGLQELHLDMFGGSLNVRKMRGGSNWSTHSWAAAMDIDPERNQFRWNDHRATLDEKEYDYWWKLWEAEGWVSLGRERNYDWMHIQAVRL